MSKELSVLVAAYGDSDSAQHDFAVLKEELPKTGRLMDRSKVIVLASSDAPNEISVEHTGGGPIGKVVERRAGEDLKGRLAPGNGDDHRGDRSRRRGSGLRRRWRRRGVARSSRWSRRTGMARRGRRPFRRRWAWRWRRSWSSGFTLRHPPRRSARSPQQIRNSHGTTQVEKGATNERCWTCGVRRRSCC